VAPTFSITAILLPAAKERESKSVSFQRANQRTLDLPGGRASEQPRRSSSRSLMALKKCGLFHIRSAVSLTMAGGRLRRPPRLGKKRGEKGRGSARPTNEKTLVDCRAERGGAGRREMEAVRRRQSVPNGSLGWNLMQVCEITICR